MRLSEVREILIERGKTHGSFTTYSSISSRLQLAMGVDELDKYDEVEKQAILMILSKLARIANGDTTHKDHWLDIGGYSQLVVDHLENGELKS